MASRCPACFGPRIGELGNGLSTLVAIDGNFSQSRYESASKYDYSHSSTPLYLDPKFIQKAKTAVQSTAAMGAVHEEFCSDSWKAKDDGKSDGVYKGKHDSGVLAVVCRHDALINLTKSGEKLYFAIAFIMFLLEIDPECKSGALYDVGCNLWAHILKRKLFEEEISKGHLQVALAVFHAYAHNWLCQMRFNPRFKKDFGLTDGEGTERFWSFLAPLIRLNRTASASLRLLSIHFRAQKWNEDHNLNLVQWLRNKLKSTLEIQKTAQQALLLAESRGWSKEKLMLEWEAQQKAQRPERDREAAEETKEKRKLLGSLLLLKDELFRAGQLMSAAIQRGAQRVENTIETMLSLNNRHGQIVEQVEQAALDVGTDKEGEHRIRISEALHRLHTRVIDLKSIYQPLTDSKKGGQGSSLGNNTLQKLLQKIKSPRTHVTKAVNLYDNAFKAYLNEFNPVKPPQLAKSLDAVLKREIGDPFWMDDYFVTMEAAWSNSAECREGIEGLRQAERAEEELIRIDWDIKRCIAWADERLKNCDNCDLRWREWQMVFEPWAIQVAAFDAAVLEGMDVEGGSPPPRPEEPEWPNPDVERGSNPNLTLAAVIAALCRERYRLQTLEA